MVKLKQRRKAKEYFYITGLNSSEAPPVHTAGSDEGGWWQEHNHNDGANYHLHQVTKSIQWHSSNIAQSHGGWTIKCRSSVLQELCQDNSCIPGSPPRPEHKNKIILQKKTLNPNCCFQGEWNISAYWRVDKPQDENGHLYLLKRPMCSQWGVRGSAGHIKF